MKKCTAQATKLPPVVISSGFSAVPRTEVLSIAEGESMTQQHMAEDCDINNIVAKFLVNGLQPKTNPLEAQFGDAPVLDLKESLDLVFAARQEFNDLPESVRQTFHNDSDLYFDYLANPEDYLEVIGGNDSSQSDGSVSSDSPSADPSETVKNADD